jgi:hypothetical protein
MQWNQRYILFRRNLQGRRKWVTCAHITPYSLHNFYYASPRKNEHSLFSSYPMACDDRTEWKFLQDRAKKVHITGSSYSKRLFHVTFAQSQNGENRSGNNEWPRNKNKDRSSEIQEIVPSQIHFYNYVVCIIMINFFHFVRKKNSTCLAYMIFPIEKNSRW